LAPGAQFRARFGRVPKRKLSQPLLSLYWWNIAASLMPSQPLTLTVGFLEIRGPLDDGAEDARSGVGRSLDSGPSSGIRVGKVRDAGLSPLEFIEALETILERDLGTEFVPQTGVRRRLHP
jgi:hypothetical protein